VLLVEGLVVFWFVGGAVLGLSVGRSASAENNAAAVRRIVSPGLSNPTAVPVEADQGLWDQHGPVNILLLGLDLDDCALPTHTKATRTDTIILVRVDPATKRASMLSIPRDLYVYVGYVPEIGRDYGARKINTAHAIGAGAFPDDPDAGPRLLADVIQRNLEISVHRYIRIDLEGFRNVIDDGFGGLDMDLPASHDDPTVSLLDTDYPDGHCGTMTVRFEPGEQHLTGEQVLEYARSRKSSSDFDRSRRQMEVLMALRTAAKSPAVIPRLPRLIPTVLDTVDTDLTTSEILSLAPIARSMSGGDITTLRMDANVVYDDVLVIDGTPQYVLRYRQEVWDNIRRQFLDLSPPPTPTPEGGTTVAPPAEG